MRKTILILAGVLLAPTTTNAGVLKHPWPCPCAFTSKPWSTACCKEEKAPPPAPKPPDDSNTCEPASCTGQWCTSCDEMGCIDIDGPGISASLCDGEFSWCTDEECHTIDVELVDGLSSMTPAEITEVLSSGDPAEGPPPPSGSVLNKGIRCPTGYKPYWSAGTDSWRCGRPVPVKSPAPEIADLAMAVHGTEDLPSYCRWSKNTDGVAKYGEFQCQLKCKGDLKALCTTNLYGMGETNCKVIGGSDVALPKPPC